jgi:glycosyltransferase involved in cell wall biosynthesis
VYQSRPFAELLNRLVGSTAFEIVHADSLVDLAGYLPGICDRIPVIGVHHNVESELLKRRASIEQSQLRRMYLNYQANLVEEVQRRWCGRVALNVAVSTADAAVLNRIAPDARVIVVPNGVDVDEFRPSNGSGGGVAYVGGMNWFPNRDALDFFCGEILPHLKQRRRELEVRWIGAASADEQHVYRDRYGVELTGYVDDVRPLVRDAACHIVPLRVGGGTRLKILNAWAMGKAVVSTSIGCEGLAATDGENILIRDGPKAFADAVATVLADDVLRRRLGNAGRETAERLYSWNRVGERMISAYSMLRRSEPRRSAVGRMECRAAQCVHE